MMSIRSIIKDINNKIYLPAIQRKYVWEDNKITELMDSIMLGYPIGTFLFWKVKKDVINNKEYSMYKFINNYHERDNYQNEAISFPLMVNYETIWSVLDGQQRLTSLYIALQGSVSRKLPHKRKNNDAAYPQKELYFDLHSKNSKSDDDDDNICYKFEFMTSADDIINKDGHLWYRVKDILRYKHTEELVTKLIVPNNWINDNLAMTNITLLHTRLVVDEIINYFEVEADSIDSILDMFIRVNSGGTVLSKSDLLFSTIVSHWDNARDEIDKFLPEINKIGEGFKFNNDFIIMTCLYVLEMSVKLKVENFTKDNVIEIKNNWDEYFSEMKVNVNVETTITRTGEMKESFRKED
jgi:uncharacterized protein with ParB-like and HNH nuclease domain